MVEFKEGGLEISVLPGPYAPDGAATDEARAFARSLIEQAERLRLFAAERYLAIYNDTWRDAEEDGPELDEKAFEPARATLVG